MLGERRTLAEWIFEPLEMRSPMKPARYKIRVHGVIFCVAALFGVILFGFNFIQRAQLFPATIFLIALGKLCWSPHATVGRFWKSESVLLIKSQAVSFMIMFRKAGGF